MAMLRMTLADFRADCATRSDAGTLAFVCPRCGNVQGTADFIALGADPSRVSQECVGRITGPRSGCNWASFGLLGTLGKGAVVVMPNGDEQEVFAFAEVP